MALVQKNNYLLSGKHYRQFQTLILNRTGMLLGQRRQNALGRGVTEQAQNMAQGDVDRYFSLLEKADTDTPLWDELIQEITIGETYFFRDKSQISTLEKHILPQIISNHQHDRRIRIWSAGCASGEEPYTLAMLLSELIMDLDQWNITILGTDIDRSSLEKARGANYRNWSFRQTDEIYKSRYFRNNGEIYQLVPWVQKRVHFSYLNLNETVYPSLATNTNALDLILCRNVAIYYSQAVIQRVAERFHRCLISGGWLMMGASETSIPVFHQYAACNFSGATVFQKRDFPVSKTVRFHMNLMGEHGHRDPIAPPLDTSMSMWEPDPGAEPFSQRMEMAKITEASPRESIKKQDEVDPFELGTQLIREKRYEEAIAHFQSCVASNPGDGASLYQLARIYANLGKMTAARSFCEQAISINPLSSEAHYTLALICQETGDLAMAMAQVKQAIFIDNRFILAHFSMTLLCQQMGQKETAQRHRQQAIRLASQLDPDKILFGSDDLTARTLLTMLKTLI